MSKKRYKVTVVEFEGEGESLKAQSLYEQTVESIDLREVILAINAKPEPEFDGIPLWTPEQEAQRLSRTRKTRSDKGKKRSAAANRAAEIAAASDPDDEPATTVYVGQDGTVGYSQPQ